MNDKIQLMDEKGNEKNFEVLATFGLDDSKYAALIPIDDNKEIVYILRIEYDQKGEMILIGIDGEELDDAIDAYESFVDNDV